MVKNPLVKTELLRWFASQKRFADLKELANAIGIPHNTLRGYFSGKSPSPQNARRLSEFLGIDLSPVLKAVTPRGPTKSKGDSKELVYASHVFDDLHLELAKCLAALISAKRALSKQVKDDMTGRTKNAQAAQALMDALQRCLEPFLDDPEGLGILREILSGSDAGYLSGLLGALFDDPRLQRWRDMTTYIYGSK